MKKYLLTAIALPLFISSAANATVKVGFGFDQGLGVTAQFDSVNVFVGNDGIAGDYIFQRGQFASDVPLNWYVGAGAFVGWDHGAGVRVPFGLGIPFSSQWDGFFQISPELDFDHGSSSDVRFGASAAIGVRVRL